MSIRRFAIFKYGSSRQQGAALLIMLVLLVVGIAAMLVNSLTSSSVKTARQATTAAALAQARDALIGYAITYGDTHSNQVHGYFPCPDISGGNPEGSAEPSCGSQDVNMIGRLPWATLDLSTLRDGNGECLWYAVSGTYKNNPKTGLMNWDTNGQLQAFSSAGTLLTPPDNQVVAVIFAPGAPLSGQDRSGTSAPICGGNYTATNYLDNDTVHSRNNADIATGKFIQPHEHRDVNGNIILTVNDQMIFITKQDIWNAIQKRTDFQNTLQLLTQRVAECIANYGNNNSDIDNHSLPWPAPLVLSDYAVSSNYNDVPYTTSSSYSGRVPYIVNNSRATTVNSIPSPYDLLKSDGANCPVPANWAAIYPWYDNWKDHLFYALSQKFEPQTGSTHTCGTCVAVNGTPYAAVVMFANSRIGTQVRTSDTTSTNRGNISNYLESNNATNYPDTNGNKNYQSQAATNSFNDVLYCIKEDLSVIPCP